MSFLFDSKRIFESPAAAAALYLSMGFLVGGLLGCAVQPTKSAKPHHTQNGFKNIYESDRNSFGDFLRWRWNAFWKDIPGPESYQFEISKNDIAFLRENRTRNTLTWIGHATVLLQLHGKNILTDPVFDKRASPVQWAGPERVAPPGIPLEELPEINCVIISHDHYDALSEPSITALFERPGGDATIFFVPLGLGEWFEKRGIKRVVELDWWEKKDSGDYTVTAVPVQHWSKRSLFSTNRTLWAGWVVESQGVRFFFAGDSGYCPHFKEIGDKFGNFDLAAIPIGAYEPRWFMAKYHMSPEESVKAHLDVRAEKSVAIHWGTFILTDEPLDEPPERLARALENNGVEKNEFIVPKHGETILLEDEGARAVSGNDPL